MPRVDVSQLRKRTEDVLPTLATNDFSELMLRPEILKGLWAAGYKKPSPIQSKAIPIGKFGADLIAQAKSGTGKTCVFGVISLENLDSENKKPQVIIIAPTRELAYQTRDVIRDIGQFFPKLQCHAFVGGFVISADIEVFSSSDCQIVCATPGRLQALIESRVMDVSCVRTLILDEADRLLEQSTQKDILWIFRSLPARKQVLSFSATYPTHIIDIVSSFMRNPQRVSLCDATVSLKGVTQYYQIMQSQEHSSPFEQRKRHVVLLLSSIQYCQCIIFTNAHGTVSKLASHLSEMGFPATSVHGLMAQNERLDAVNALRKFSIRVLISSDLTSRGIDMDRVNLVINLDIPRDPETYLHRVGRTGRFGTYGIAITVIEEADLPRLLAMASTCQTTIDPMPEEIPRSLYEFEITQEEQEILEKMEKGRKEREAVVSNNHSNSNSRNREGNNSKVRNDNDGEEHYEEEDGYDGNDDEEEENDSDDDDSDDDDSDDDDEEEIMQPQQRQSLLYQQYYPHPGWGSLPPPPFPFPPPPHYHHQQHYPPPYPPYPPPQFFNNNQYNQYNQPPQYPMFPPPPTFFPKKSKK